MGRLVYFTIASFDGFVEDSNGDFRFTRPDEEAFRYVNELVRPVTMHLLGRRMYEVMLYWEAYPGSEGATEIERDFAKMWRSAEKIVYSRSLSTPSSKNTRIEQTFEPEEVLRLKRENRGDLSVAGANLAGQAIQAGLVDELQLLVAPTVVGGGKPWLPRGVKLSLELVESHRFETGFMLLRYRVRRSKTDQHRKTQSSR